MRKNKIVLYIFLAAGALVLSGNQNMGYGGFCAGDSGGPTFVEYEGKL